MKLLSLIFSTGLLVLICCTSYNQSDNREIPNGQDDDTSLREKIGQMLIIGFRGDNVKDIGVIKKNIVEDNLGGVILFDYDIESEQRGRNIKSPYQLKKMICELNELSKTPLFISLDQEGGKVNRLKYSTGFFEIPSAQKLGRLNNLDSTKYYNAINAEMLAHFGFNMNFAPVVDVDLNTENPVIHKYERSYSSDPSEVVQHAEKAIESFEQNNIIPVIKHFPGHGSSSSDSHEGMVDITNHWTKQELIPYKKLIENNKCDVIMTAHIVNRNIDTLPATLSNKTMAILRKELNFKGVIISDDMQMKAINNIYGLKFSIEKAINAGVDILLFGNNISFDENICDKVITIIENLVKEGKISKSRIHEAYNRIVKLKSKLKAANCENNSNFIVDKAFLLGKIDQYKDSRFIEIHTDYAVRSNIFILNEVYQSFKKMSDAAKTDGIELKIVSGTRNFEEQKYIWERKWNGKRLVDNKKLNVEVKDHFKRSKIIMRYSSMPGTSRHHWGTDIDINNVEPEYFETPKGKLEYKWLTKNANKFGFCLTYTSKNTIRKNGYEEEKWHWSYLPISSMLTEQYRTMIKYEDIKGFSGSNTAKKNMIFENYVFGLNYKCR